MTSTAITRPQLVERDAADPLAGLRDAFALPAGVIYLDGNSLGALPRETIARLDRAVGQEWGEDLIRSWTSHDWINLPATTGDKISRVIGGEPGEVVVTDSTSINLFKLLAAALRLRPERRVVLTEAGNFPTDVYIAQGLIEQAGGRHEIRYAAADTLADVIDDQVAVVMVTHVNYQTGRMHDMAALTTAAHASGALMLWDLSHSAGAVPVNLNAAGADFAVGCGYKYLNGGPGAPAFLFVARRLQAHFHQPLSGWMGHAAPFDFDASYQPAPGILRALCGTPPVLSLTALDSALDVFLRADMADIRQKSLALTDTFIALIEQECGDFGFEIATPRAPAQRGSQVSLRSKNGYAIVQALIARGVIGDFRTPDILRFGFAPLYLRFVDVWDAVAALRDIMEQNAWDRAAYQRRAAVT